MMRTIENVGVKLLSRLVPAIDVAAVQTVCEPNYQWSKPGYYCRCNRWGTSYSCWPSYLGW